MEPKVRPSPMALTVLSLLNVGPLHPYGMQRLIKLWGKDDVVNVGQRANLYKTIKRLLDADLISVHNTERDQLYPERTVYALTENGRKQGMDWLSEMLAAYRNEFPEFPAALSFVMLLAPGDFADVLDRRAREVRAWIGELDASLSSYGGNLPRVTLLDTEYKRAVAAAELAWMDGVVADIRAGELSWTYEELAKHLTT